MKTQDQAFDEAKRADYRERNRSHQRRVDAALVEARMDAERRKRMRELRAAFKDSGNKYKAAAVRTAEFGHGWQAIQLSSWGHITNDEAKILYVGHTDI